MVEELEIQVISMPELEVQEPMTAGPQQQDVRLLIIRIRASIEIPEIHLIDLEATAEGIHRVHPQLDQAQEAAVPELEAREAVPGLLGQEAQEVVEEDPVEVEAEDNLIKLSDFSDSFF
jgi:hypothetical protein